MSVLVHTGDCRTLLSHMAPGSVDCCVTSPPYYGLRDYGHEGQMGLEPTPDEYIAGMVDVFRHVRKVLRDDGTLWLNIGDSYSAGGRGNDTPKQKSNKGTGIGVVSQPWRVAGYGPKQLLGIPWRLAFALQADGWILRQDIIWSKPNPMPESITDRCTKAHEYLFLLAKRPRYYFDAEAIAEPLSANPVTQARNERADKGIVGPMALHGTCYGQSGIGGWERAAADQRNKRSVWTVATQPFSEAHFATFPPDLIEPCIKAGCPVGGTVLDPFGGAGTTGLVADRLQRNAILIELNPEYAAMARRRIDNDRGGLLDAMEAA